MNHEEWLAARRYRIVRSNRNLQVPVDSGLTWDAAKLRASELNEAERKAHPELDSWTRDIFFPQMETPAWNPKR